MKLIKPLPLFSLTTAVIVALFAMAAPVSAQLVAYDDAGNYLLNANWTNGANGGFGFTPWAIETNGPNAQGTYVGTPSGYVINSVTNVTGTNYTSAWGLYANGLTDVNESTAYRGFASSLGTNTFKLQWGSRGAGATATTNSGTVHGWCGFSLRNGNNTNAPYNFNSPDGSAVFFLYFLDGAPVATIYFWDGHGVQSVPGTSFSDLGRTTITNAIEAEITPAADGVSYHLVLKDCVQNRTIFTTNSTFISSGTVDSAALFCYETTGDQIYNRMQIAASTNIAPTIVNVMPTSGGIYLDPTTNNLSFEIDSFNSTVLSSTVKVYLNGALQAGTIFNSASPTNQLLGTNNATLNANTFYNYSIVAQDANGNVVSNNFTFNTFTTNDVYIDAYDYNYNQGLFINSNTPVNAYAGLAGSNSIDYSIADLTGTNNTAGYRPLDLVEILTLPTDATGDPLDHDNLRGNGFTAYNIGFTDTGNWENYTRNYPTTNYSIYARAASTTGGQFEIEKLANATATTTNQPLAALGRVTFSNTGGSKVYSGQLAPLTDVFGNTVVMPLSGNATLRETALASRIYNLEYFVAVSVTNGGTLRPYIATGSPGPNSAGVSLTSPITFNLANRTTIAQTNAVQLILNGTNISSRLVLSSNLAGVAASWTPTNNLPTSYTNLVTIIFTDNTGTSVTNSWNFYTGTTGGVLGNGLWSGAGGTNDMFWADGINWTGGTPAPGFNAVFANPGATTTLATNNIVATNVTVQGLFYDTNSVGFHTTWIQDGVTLIVSNNTTGGATAIVQAGGTTTSDTVFNHPATNTITGMNGTLLVVGNDPRISPNTNNLNFQVRQSAFPAAPNVVTLDMSGLGTLIATLGKFYVAQGGSGFAQSNVTGCVYLARTNVIACLRPNAGQFEVGDSSGGLATLPGSTLNFGITNTVYADTIRLGKQKATNNIIRFNPAFTNGIIPSLVMRGGTNGVTSRVFNLTIGDADTETTFPDFVQASVDLTGGKLDALIGNLVLGRGETSASDTGFAQGTFTFTAGTLDVTNVQAGVQRAVNTATASGTLNVNGTATLVSSNIILAVTNAGSTASFVTGTLNATNGTVRGSIYAGGGTSTVNIIGGTLIVSNTAGTTALPLTAVNLSSASLHLKADGNATVAVVNAVGVSAGSTMITVDSVANVTGPKTIHLISYTGSDPFAGLALAPLPSGYTGSLADDAGVVDLNINVAVSVPPTIQTIKFSGGQLIITGTNNVGAGGTYSVLTTTNLTVAITNWTVFSSGSFDGSGNFSVTNASATNNPSFYMLRVP
jgi:hypothetical protein